MPQFTPVSRTTLRTDPTTDILTGSRARRLRCPGGFPRFAVNCRVVALLAIASSGACGLVADAGTVTNLGALANDDTRARAISGDGSVVVGGSYDGNYN